ncbi:UPF0739 protein C1orf74 homolog [Ylistrum balloti]|uniref:UPF0739 protein C1orf74 homolog n=1 Tax=Ylistrum balloti TaxID=509963 RepID=UPI002905C326|nr:UPF0739 protein C1orf74 homolog [Ylistrum balloti]
MASATKQGNDTPMDIRLFVRRHMGKKFKYAFELFTNIRLVDLDVKPSYLLDYGVGDTAKLVSLLIEMKNMTYITNILTVLQLGIDIIIINQLVIKMMQNSTAALESKCTIVDVSKTLNSPQVMSESVHVFDKLKVIFNDMPPDFQRIRQFTVDCKNANLTTVFGVLLGYPIVYWFENQDGLMATCLDTEPLENFRVIGNITDTGSEHCLYSFSVPKFVIADLQDKVTEWFKVIYDNTNWKPLFSDLTLTNTTVQLDTVAL